MASGIFGRVVACDQQKATARMSKVGHCTRDVNPVLNSGALRVLLVVDFHRARLSFLYRSRSYFGSREVAMKRDVALHTLSHVASTGSGWRGRFIGRDQRLAAPRDESLGPGRYAIQTPRSTSAVRWRPELKLGPRSRPVHACRRKDEVPGPGAYPRHDRLTGSSLGLGLHTGRTCSQKGRWSDSKLDNPRRQTPGPNSFVQPSDMLSSRSTSLATSGRRGEFAVQGGVGPGQYELPQCQSGPAWSLSHTSGFGKPGKRKGYLPQSATPGAELLPSTLRQQGAVLGIRVPQRARTPPPGPVGLQDSENPLSVDIDKKGFTFAGGFPQQKPKDDGPGPAAYNPREAPGKHSPSWGMGKPPRHVGDQVPSLGPEQQHAVFGGGRACAFGTSTRDQALRASGGALPRPCDAAYDLPSSLVERDYGWPRMSGRPEHTKSTLGAVYHPDAEQRWPNPPGVAIGRSQRFSDPPGSDEPGPETLHGLGASRASSCKLLGKRREPLRSMETKAREPGPGTYPHGVNFPSE